jgi:hypothetical protein
MWMFAILSCCDVYFDLFDGSAMGRPINLSHAATDTPLGGQQVSTRVGLATRVFLFPEAFLPVRYLIKKT